MDELRTLFNKNSKSKYNVYIAFLLGVIILIVSGIDFNKNEIIQEVEKPRPANVESYTSNLEKKLEVLLSTVKGAGKVKVMITLVNEGELILAKDIDFNYKETIEKDGENGLREIREEKEKTETLFSPNTANKNAPVVLKELKPQIEGVAIIAEGGGDINIVEAFTRVAESLLNVPVHKIQVLKMK